MPYTKSGVFYTAKPGPPSRTSTKARYGGGYMGGPKYQPGYYRAGAQGNPKYTAAYAAAVAAQETKYFDTAFNGTVTWAGTDWAASELPMATYVNSSGASAAYTDSAIIPSANGSAYGQVDGTKYKLLKVRVRGSMTVALASAQTTTLNACKVRILLVEDLMPAGAQAQGEDILQDVGAGGENLHSFLRIPNGLGKYRILQDKTMVLQPTTAVNNASASTVSVGYQTVKFKLGHRYKTPQDVTIKAGNATPTVAGLINRNVFVLVAGWDLSNSAVKGVVCSGACRAYYKD